jgi:hypothetical protein
MRRKPGTAVNLRPGCREFAGCTSFASRDELVARVSPKTVAHSRNPQLLKLLKLLSPPLHLPNL